MKKIGIDCRLAGLSHAGIGRYISSFVPRVLKLLDSETEIVLFCSTNQQARELYPTKLANVKIVIAPYKHYSLSEQTAFLTLLNKEKLDLLHVPHFNVPIFYSRRFVVTIHDLLWHKQRGLQVTTLNPVLYWLKYFFYKQVVSQAVRKALAILVPSQTIADELSAVYPATQKKAIVTYEGVEHSLLNSTHLKQTKKSNHLLYVGSLYPHKNISLVLQFLQLHPDVQLAIVTARSAFVERVQKQVAKLQLKKQVSFFLSIEDKELATHYRRVTAVIQPSFSEGFGLTGLEALLLQTPVLASDIPIFHEIYQENATYFDPHDVSSLEQAWQKIKDRPQQQPLSKAFINRYNWDTLAKQTCNVYQTALS
ncbi:MAG: glycosyltransferase family 1 protein [bacterium]|nr:glycosyltransferase family 1 protein [bacterium]